MPSPRHYRRGPRFNPLILLSFSSTTALCGTAIGGRPAVLGVKAFELRDRFTWSTVRDDMPGWIPGPPINAFEGRLRPE